MREILVLTAMLLEQRELAAGLEQSVQQTVAGKSWRSGSLGPSPVRLVETGIGAVNAAHALTCALQAFRPALVVQVGVGGAYLDVDLDRGDLALASEENYGDLGVRAPDGWHSAELIGIPVLQQEESFYNCFPLDRDLVLRAAAVLDPGGGGGPGPRLRIGPFVTVQECSGVTALGQERAGRFRAICENMEGAAAAHLCQLYRVPFLEVRGISNMVEDRRSADWDLPRAAARAQAAALRLLGEPGQLLGEGQP